MESTDLTRIFVVVTILTLIIYADPGTAGGGSARAAEDTALVNLPVDKIADFEEIESIDEAAEKLNRRLEGEKNKYEISSEIQFFSFIVVNRKN